MKNILLIKLRYLGDVLLATPVARALRDLFPDARLTMAVNRGTEDLLTWNRDLDEVLVVERGSLAEQVRFVREMRRRRFDCVIDLTDGDRSAVLTWLSGSPVRVGFNEEHRWRGLLYSAVAKVGPQAVHRIEHDLEALRPLGLEPRVFPPLLRTGPEDEAAADQLLEEMGVRGTGADLPLVWLQPGARYWFKAWPTERFGELADHLAESYGCRLLIGGDARERPIAEEIRARARTSPLVLAGRTTILGLAAILKRCALFVGNDNGPMHMAAALGVPVVALFGPSDPAIWGPRGEKAEVLYKGLDCRRCFHPTCFRGEESCMKQISVEEVLVAARKLLGPRVDGQGPRTGDQDDAGRITENLLRCAELTELCTELRDAVLRQEYPDQDVSRRPMEEVREAKERAWRRHRS